MTANQVGGEKDMGDTKPLRMAVVGTLPPPVCGTTVSLALLIESLRNRHDVELRIVNTSRIRGHGVTGVFRFLAVAWQLAKTFRSSDVVSLHLNPYAVAILGPLALAYRACFATPVMLRLFGGQDFTEIGGISGRLFLRVAKRVDLYLCQTRGLMESARANGITQVGWYPTNRPLPDAPAEVRDRRICRKFVVIGWVNRAKGIPEILHAAERFDDSIRVDVYGPFAEGLSERDFELSKRTRYCGMIAPGHAVDVLRRYDALLFPTHWIGEGYPGVVIEAYHAGIPVITTCWRSIPEIVDASSGILIEPRDVDALHAAMKMVIEDDQLYRQLAAGAARKSVEFSTEKWTEQLVNYCREIMPAENH